MDAYTHAVVGIIQKDNAFLVGKKGIRDTHPLSGKWHLPGGKLDKGESDEVGLMREIMEETGLVVKIGKFLGEEIRDAQKCIVHFYLCNIVGGNLAAGDDLTDVQFVTGQQVLEMVPDERVASCPKCVRECFAQ